MSVYLREQTKIHANKMKMLVSVLKGNEEIKEQLKKEKENKHKLMEALKNIVYAGVGLATTTSEKIRETINELVEKGKISDTEGKRIIDDIFKTTESTMEEFESKVKTMTDKINATFDFKGKKEDKKEDKQVVSLEKKVAALEKELAEAKKAADVKAVASKSTAPKKAATPKKTAATKTVATKKTTTTKAKTTK